MDRMRRPVGPLGVVVNVGLGVTFALGIGGMAYLLIQSWGGNYWVYTTAVASLTSLCALLRERYPFSTAAAGVVVTAAAVWVSRSVRFELPQEPSPVTSLALAVLVGSAIRRLPGSLAFAIAAGGCLVVAFTWASGLNALNVVVTVLVLGALIVGLILRVFARVRPNDTATTLTLEDGHWNPR